MFGKQDEIFFKVKGSPYFWRQKAQELKYAAEVLWPGAEERMSEMTRLASAEGELNLDSLPPDTFPIFLSLIGFSTECLFKGVAIRDNPAFISNGTLASKLTSHDLVKLAAVAKIPLSHHEKLFCQQAFKAMVVDSRYPIAKVIGEPDNSMEIGGHCKEVFNGIYERLYPTLGQLHAGKKKRWFQL